MKTVLFFVLATTSLFVKTLLANEFVANIDRNPVLENESFTLSLQFFGNPDGSPDISILNKDFVVMGTSQMQQTSVINGKRTQSITWTIQLLPKQVGTFDIPAIVYAGAKSNPISVIVQKASQNGQKKSFYLSIDATIDSHEVYVGQQVLLTLTLKRKPNVEYRGLSTSLDHLELKELGKPSEYQSIENGVRYTNHQLKYIFFPEKPGSIEIPTIVFTGDVKDSGRLYPSMFRSSRSVTARSKPININVKEKPANAPTPWLPSSNVTLAEQLEPNISKFKEGEPITWTVQLSAAGLRDIDLPAFQLPDLQNAKVYADEPQVDNRMTQQGNLALKNFKFAIVPTQAGKLQLPEFKIAWWNTEKDQLEHAVIPSKTFEVIATPDANTANTPDSASPVQEVSPLTAIPSSPQTMIKTNPVWQWLTFIFAALWVSTLCYWYISRKQTQGKQVTVNALEEHSRKLHWSDIASACKQNDPQKAKKALIDWSNHAFRPLRFSSLSDLNHIISDKALNNALRDLEKALYSDNATPWEGSQLLSLLVNLKQESKAHQKKQHPNGAPLTFNPV